MDINEIIETEDVLTGIDDTLTDDMFEEEIIEESFEADLDAELAAAFKAQEAREAVYAEQSAELEAAAETTEGDKPVTAEVAPKKRGRKAKAEKPAKAKVEKEPKADKPKVAYKHEAPKSTRLMQILGERARDFLVFETDDFSAGEEIRAAKVSEFLNALDSATADKVGDKALMLFKHLSEGKHISALNEVMLRAFKVLLKEGELTSGQNGNLQTELLAKPYSGPTAASQSNQIFMLFPLLKITVKEKGRMVKNPESLILARIESDLANAA